MADRYRVKISVKRINKHKGERVKPGFDLQEEVHADTFSEAYNRVAKVALTLVAGLDQEDNDG